MDYLTLFKTTPSLTMLGKYDYMNYAPLCPGKDGSAFDPVKAGKSKMTLSPRAHYVYTVLNGLSDSSPQELKLGRARLSEELQVSPARITQLYNEARLYIKEGKGYRAYTSPNLPTSEEDFVVQHFERCARETSHMISDHGNRVLRLVFEALTRRDKKDPNESPSEALTGAFEDVAKILSSKKGFVKNEFEGALDYYWGLKNTSYPTFLPLSPDLTPIVTVVKPLAPSGVTSVKSANPEVKGRSRFNPPLPTNLQLIPNPADPNSGVKAAASAVAPKAAGPVKRGSLISLSAQDKANLLAGKDLLPQSEAPNVVQRFGEVAKIAKEQSEDAVGVTLPPYGSVVPTMQSTNLSQDPAIDAEVSVEDDVLPDSVAALTSLVDERDKLNASLEDSLLRENDLRARLEEAEEKLKVLHGHDAGLVESLRDENEHLSNLNSDLNRELREATKELHNLKTILKRAGFGHISSIRQ